MGRRKKGLGEPAPCSSALVRDVRNAPCAASPATAVTRWLSRNAVAVAALFVALGTTASAATYVVSSNSQVAPSTIAGHHTPSGDTANIIAATINGTDIQPGAIGSAQLAAPQGWRAIAANPEQPADPCSASPPTTGVFCGTGSPDVPGLTYGWFNYGSPFTPGGYYRDLEGAVHLHGLVASQYCTNRHSSSTVIFILPPGYRPSHRLVLHADEGSADQHSDVVQRIDVLPTGEVEVVNAVVDSAGCLDLGYLSLDGISFRVGE
jgi:hypothetical protein